MARIAKIDVEAYGRPYEVRWSWYDADTKRHFKKERFRTEREAKAKKREVEQSVADANMPDYAAGRAAFKEWAERWYEAKLATRKPSTARGYRSILDTSVLPAFGQRRIRAISAADVSEWVTGLSKAGLTPPTIKHHHGVLRAVFAFAARHHAVTYNPARDVDLPTDKAIGRRQHEPQFLTGSQVEQIARLLDASCSPYGLVVRFTAYTGLRASEVAGLDVGDLDFLGRQVVVHRTRRRVKGGWEVHTPKSGETRRVPLPPWLVEDLAAYLATEHPNGRDLAAPLFPGRTSEGRPGGRFGVMDYTRPFDQPLFYKRMFKPAVKAAGLPASTRYHDLRHTYASLSASAGTSLDDLAEYMGHKDATITRTVYRHLYTTDAQAHAARLVRPTVETEARVIPIV